MFFLSTLCLNIVINPFNACTLASILHSNQDALWHVWEYTPFFIPCQILISNFIARFQDQGMHFYKEILRGPVIIFWVFLPVKRTLKWTLHFPHKEIRSKLHFMQNCNGLSAYISFPHLSNILPLPSSLEMAPGTL